ncbi:MAG TPA: hypothetical protein VIL46_06625, partial [Gemmataceae bacterium]
SPGSAEQDPLAEAVRSAAGGAPVEVERTGPNVLRVRLRVAEAAAAEPTVNRIAALPALAPYRVDFEVEVGR